MSDDNPYSPPKVDVDLPTVMAESVPELGLFRHGNWLVASHGVTFPDRCPVTNQPATTRYPYEFSTIPIGLKWIVWLTAGRLFSKLIDSMSYKIKMKIPLDDAYIRSYRLHFGSVAAISFAGLALVLAGLCVEPLFRWSAPLVGIGVLTLLAALVWNWMPRRDLDVHTVSATHAWISGVHPDFLAELPEWQGRR